MLDDRFLKRACPCCAGNKRQRLFDLPADAFCRVNWSYARDYANILGLSGDTKFPIARCTACGFVYAELQPSTDFLADLYDRVVRHDRNRDAAESRAGIARRMRYVATLLELISCKSLPKALDFGCGLGATSRLLAAAGVAAVGYDASSVRNCYVKDAGLVIATSYEELRSHGPFDIVVCDNVLEHMPNPAETIAFLAAVTSQEGVLYMSVPDYGNTFIASQLRLFGLGQPIDMSLNPLEHLNYFDLSHLDRLLEQGGFSPVPRTSLPGEVNIGLRPEESLRKRVNNSLASGVRLAKYAVMTETVRTVTHEFYRLSESRQACAE